MKLKIITKKTREDREMLEITSEKSRIIVGFGDGIASRRLTKNTNPMIEGLTCGKPAYDAIFILRNPENSNIVEHTLKEIPLVLERKVKINYETYIDFSKVKRKERVIEIRDSNTIRVKDLEITSFIIDGSNHNTAMLLVKSAGKSVLITGDFRNYDISYEKGKLENCLNIIGNIDYLFVEGKYFGKYGVEYSSGKEILDKLKNIMKFYKQVFVIQSETDLITAYNMYMSAQKTKKIFIESTLLANLTSLATGSAPNPISSKKVYTYTPLVLENEDFEFKKKYVTPFYIHNANNKMKKEKYVMNVTTEMLQDIQLFEKEGSIYDSCVIFSMSKDYLEKNEELEEFIKFLKDLGMDYYELYTRGQVCFEVLKKMETIFKAKSVIPIDFSTEDKFQNPFNNFKYLQNEESIII